MKNNIPVVLAVVLGFAAVMAVSRMLSTSSPPGEETVEVVSVVKTLNTGHEVTANDLQAKRVRRSDMPVEAVEWRDRSSVVGQKLNKTASSGDYLLTTSIVLSRSLAGVVSPGEWAVSIPGGAMGIGKKVQPGDEVAVVGTYESKTKGMVTSVLFPKVRVVETLAGSRSDEAGDVVLALPPKDAQILIAAEGKVKLTLALRSPSDTKATNRTEIGKVDEETWTGWQDENIESVKVPQ